MSPTDCRQENDSTTALERQTRLNAWARRAAECLIEGDRRLAQRCLDKIACIRRETEINWEIES